MEQMSGMRQSWREEEAIQIEGPISRDETFDQGFQARVTLRVPKGCEIH
jgi:hypothetical protein